MKKIQELKKAKDYKFGLKKAKGQH